MSYQQHGEGTQIGALSRRRFLGLAGTAIGATAVGSIAAACGGSPAKRSSAGPAVPTGSELKAIKDLIGPISAKTSGKGLHFPLGAILPLTGSGASYGVAMSRGMELAVQHIKDMGGPDMVPSVKNMASGVPPTVGIESFNELAAAGVPAMLLSYVADLGALLPLIPRAKILCLDGGGGTSVYGEGVPYFYGLRAKPAISTYPGVLEYLKRTMPERRRIVTLSWNYGKNNSKYYAAQSATFSHWGYSEDVSALTVLVPSGTSDFAGPIETLAGLKPQLLLTRMFGNDPGYFMRQYVTSGIDVPVIGSEFTRAAAKVAGSAYDHYMFAFDYFDAQQPTNPWAAFFVKEFEATYGEAPNFYSANYYEDTFALWTLIRRVLAKGGDVSSGTELNDALLADPSFKSVYGGNATSVGTLTLNRTTHSVESRPLGLFAFSGGEPVPLAFFNLHGANFRFLRNPLKADLVI